MIAWGQTFDEPEVENLFDIHPDIQDTTIVQLGNLLCEHSLNKQYLDKWVTETSSLLESKNCNLILLRGDRDCADNLYRINNSYIRGITSPRKIDNCLFVPKGMTSNISFYRDLTLTQLQERAFILNAIDFSKVQISYIFSIIPPLYIMLNKYKDGKQLIKSQELSDMWLASQLLLANNESLNWYFAGNDREIWDNIMFYNVPNEFILHIKSKNHGNFTK